MRPADVRAFSGPTHFLREKHWGRGWKFSPVHGFCQKNRTFYHLFFGGKSIQKRSFFDILDEKECFLDPKHEVLKMFKISKF